MKKLLITVFIISLLSVSCESVSQSESSAPLYTTPEYSKTYHVYDPYYDTFSYDGTSQTGYFDSSGYTEVDSAGNVITHDYDGSTRTYLNDGSYYYQDNSGVNTYFRDGWNNSSAGFN